MKFNAPDADGVRRLAAAGSVFVLLSMPLEASAEDVAAEFQPVGNHSTVHTPDGGIRDDEFVEFICDQIKANGGKVKDVKFMGNACYGGGILDDLERVFGEGGPCEGVPWVGGTASAHDQVAWGWSDDAVDEYPSDNLGSSWTDGLAGNSRFNNVTKPGVIRNGSAGNNVLNDLKAAVQNDDDGPNGTGKESPQVASGNGGDRIPWNSEGARHEAVLFGGEQDSKRHHNNIENMEAALKNVWGSSPYNIQAIDGGNRQDLLDAIEAAAGRLDENTQLVIYIDDHGGSRFDFDEAIGEVLSILVEDETTLEADLPPGWFQGIWGNFLQLVEPYPVLQMYIEQCIQCSNWTYLWNGYPLAFPANDPTGVVLLAIPFYKILQGLNQLQIIPQGPGQVQANGTVTKGHFGVLEVSNLEVRTGGVTELESDQRLIPAQSAAFFDPDRNGEGIFVELLENGQAVVYVFTYRPDGSGQSWMIGIGQQVGYGIVINDVYLPTGPTFGSDYDPDDLVLNPFGSLAFGFPGCGSGDYSGFLAIPPGLPQGYSDYLQDINYRQLTEIVDCETGEKSANSGYSGSWFDPTHNGEGIILQVLTSGTVLAQWFTYDKNGNQMWVQGTGAIEGNTLTIDTLRTTRGARYGVAFDPDDVVLDEWGSMTMVFGSCGEATVNYQSTAGFGNGTLNMVRLTKLMGIDCED